MAAKNGKHDTLPEILKNTKSAKRKNKTALNLEDRKTQDDRLWRNILESSNKSN